MYDHSLTELSGRSTMHALDFTAVPLSGDEYPAAAGGVMTLTSAGYFTGGLGNGVASTIANDHNAPMAIFAIQGIDEFDANSDIGNISGGNMSGLVASGGYEIQTTEFVSGTFYPNDTLTFAETTDRGKVELSAAAYSTENIVGVVSRGVVTNADAVSTLSFWTVWAPASNLT